MVFIDTTLQQIKAKGQDKENKDVISSCKNKKKHAVKNKKKHAVKNR